MKKLLYTALLILTAGAAQAANPTLRMGLTIPATGQFNYPTIIANDYQILDSSTAILGQPNTFTSSNTFSGSASTVTVSQDLVLSYVGTLQCLATDGSKNVVGQACAGSGGTGLGVFNGSSGSSGVTVSSPTGGLNFASSQFIVALQGPSTAYVTLNQSSVTVQGNTFNGNSQLTKTDGSGHLPSSVFSGAFILSTGTLQSGATFYVSSGTAVQINASTATVATLLQVNGTGLSGSQVAGQIMGSAFNVTAAGNVGLGTAVPGYALDEQQGTANFALGVNASTVTVSTMTLRGEIIFKDGTVQATAPVFGAANLAVSSGTLSSSVIVSSPTSNIVFDNQTFKTTLQGGTSSFVTVNFGAGLSGTSFLGVDGTGTVIANPRLYTTDSPDTLNFRGATPTFNLFNTAGSGQLHVTINNADSSTWIWVYTNALLSLIGSDGLQLMGYNTATNVVEFTQATVSLNSHKLTHVTDGTVSTDAATFGQTVHLTSSLQSGATFFVSSGTVAGNLSVSSLTLTSAGLTNTVLATNSAGVIISTTVSSGGSGTVNAGAVNQVAYYASAGTALNGTSTVSVYASSVTVGDATHSVILSSNTTAGGTLAMGANKITGLANGSASTDAAAFGQVIQLGASLQSGATFYVSSGTVNNLRATTSVIVSTNISFSPTTAGIQGTTTNDNAGAGIVGEYIEDNHGFTNVPASTHYTAISTITLTAGDWDVTGIAVFTGNGATSVTDLEMLITSTSGDNTTGGTTAVNYVYTNGLTTGVTNNTTVIPVYRVSVSTSTSYYLKVSATYSTGTPQAATRLSARRVR